MIIVLLNSALSTCDSEDLPNNIYGNLPSNSVAISTETRLRGTRLPVSVNLLFHSSVTPLHYTACQCQSAL